MREQGIYPEGEKKKATMTFHGKDARGTVKHAHIFLPTPPGEKLLVIKIDRVEWGKYQPPERISQQQKNRVAREREGGGFSRK